MSIVRGTVCWLLVVGITMPTLADDWPRWLGPESASTWHDPQVDLSFGQGDLEPRWQADISYGYAGPAVADGKVYVFDYLVTEGEVVNNPGRPIQLQGQERLHCLDAATGERLWTDAQEVPYNISYPGGPRATPTVDGDRVYTLGAEGDLVCRRTADGQVLWHVNYLQQYETKTPIWGHASSPLVVGELVCTIVGGEGTEVVAFDKRTGKEAWRALSSAEPGYASCVLMELDGQPRILACYPSGTAAIEPKTGEVVWNKRLQPKFGMAIAPPRRAGDRMFVTSYGESMLLTDVDSADPTIAWRSNSARESVYCSNAPPYFAEDAIFGCDIEASALMAIDPDSGERLWENQEVVVGDEGGRSVRHGTAFIVRHAPTGKYLLLNERGELLVASLTRDGIEVHSRAQLLEPTNEAFGRSVVWSHPAFADGCVFARNDKQIVCVRLAE